MVIYALFDTALPTDIRYIGKTSQRLVVRVRKHLQRAIAGQAGRRAAWIRSVLKAGRRVDVVVLATASSDSELDRLEREFIATYRTKGGLLNATDGGDGGAVDAATRERIRATLQGHAVSDLTRARMRAAGLGRVVSVAAREKLRAFNVGTTLTAAHRAKIGAAHKGRPGRSPSPETLAKRAVSISAAKRGIAFTPQHCEALRKAWRSPEARAARCASLREGWKRRKARVAAW